MRLHLEGFYVDGHSQAHPAHPALRRKFLARLVRPPRTFHSNCPAGSNSARHRSAAI